MNRTGRRVLGESLLAGMLACLGAPAHAAADSEPLRPGDRIRYSTSPGRGDTKEGIVVELADTTLTVDRSDGAAKLRLPIAALTKLEVARGKRRPIVEGALLGALAGMLVIQSEDENAAYARMGAMMYGFLGGGVIGAITRLDRWKEVSKHEIRLSAGPLPGGFGGQVSLRF